MICPAVCRRVLPALLILLLLLPGCVPLQTAPRIEAVTRLEVVDWRRMPDGRGAANTPPLWAVRVEFSADRDLFEFYNQNGRTVRNEVWPCRAAADPSGGVIASDPYVFNASGPVDSRSDQRDGRPNRPASGAYHLFIFVETERTLPASGAPRSYPADHDLRHDRNDLCFRLRGASMLGGDYASNTALIPYADIRAALDRSGM